MRRAAATTLVAVLAALGGGCGSGGEARGDGGRTSTASAATTTTSGELPPPGRGKPQVTIGDKNFTEQFVLGELYRQALQAQGYDVSLNRNIGPPEVTIPAIKSGRVDLYPEYLYVWNDTIADLRRQFAGERPALQAAQRYARAQGLRLLSPTPFSHTSAIAVSPRYAQINHLRTLADLRRVSATLTLGAPPQFQLDPRALPALQQAYGFAPATFTPLSVGSQYGTLDHGKIEAAAVDTTDGQLARGRYRVLEDPKHVFGWGNVVPVVSARALAIEGPAFRRTIERVNALLTLPVIRRLNAEVDLSGGLPGAVAHGFLQSQGLLRPQRP